MKSTDAFTMKLTKEQKDRIRDIKIGIASEVIKNPYSGIEVELSPEAVAIYDIIKGSEYSLYHNPNSEELLNLFYTARDIFINNWPKEYSLLLD